MAIAGVVDGRGHRAVAVTESAVVAVRRRGEGQVLALRHAAARRSDHPQLEFLTAQH